MLLFDLELQYEPINLVDDYDRLDALGEGLASLTQSMTTSAPSVTRRAAVTFKEKSTCPGKSMRLIPRKKRGLSAISTVSTGKYISPSVLCLIALTLSLSTEKSMT